MTRLPPGSPSPAPPDPTTPDRSCAPPPERSGSTSTPTPIATTAPPSPSGIRFEDRSFLTGATGCGKSTAARTIARSTPDRVLVIDPSDSTKLGPKEWPGIQTFRDPRAWPDAQTVRYVPSDPGDLDAYDEVYRLAYLKMRLFILCDEAGIVLPAQGSPRWARTVLIQGRKRSIGHLACHTRPREVDANVIAQAQHLLIWSLPNPDDRKRLADTAGVDRGELESTLATRTDPAFVYFSQRERALTPVAAIGHA